MADKDKDKDQTAGGAAKQAGPLDNKVILLGAVVVLQVVLAVGLTTLVIVPRLGSGHGSVAEVGTASPGSTEELGVLLSLGEIIVTLQSEGKQARFLRITVDLELADEVASTQAAARLPILRDTVIMTLADRTAEDLNRPEGMKGLRDELMRRLDEKLPGGLLRHIYFSDLVIQ
ncbi:MAG TPA: flagellar basal body-associated FliL family protein [Candidatus Krumholzibacteria bacterium]|nr:flagellar basal body-associated FliL family protein [Candidatus Krumholzibacteria bacterium]HPD71618.1 flagellar basal body-associated FliL family protein [Candidatus Krumholzibacteria bacterium]HRY41449.1 flagellar basal body-associated FliL family protein [Candidatus Krumholzibacteria bacterium]